MPYSPFSGLTLVTPTVADPVSVADIKAHSRVYIDLHDSLIAGYIASATIICEDHTKRAFMPQTWRLALEQWPGRSPMVGYREATSIPEWWRWSYIELPKPPLDSIVAFTYKDTSGTVFNMTQLSTPGQMNQNQVGNYLLDTEPEPGCVRLPFAGIWPTTILLPGSPIQITYNCGYNAFSGTLSIDQNGACTLGSGGPFDPTMRGTWINLQDPGSGVNYSLNVLSVTDTTHIQLVVSQELAPTLVGSGLTWTASSVPQPIRSAIMFLVAHLYENREPIVVGRSQTAIEIPQTIDAMLAPYKIYRTG